MRLVDAQWNVISATVGSSWHLTTTLMEGSYIFIAEWEDSDGEDWVRFEPLNIDCREDPLFISFEALGLLPRQDVYLPLALSTS